MIIKFSFDTPERVDKYLMNTLENISREKVKELIRSGNITVNDEVVKPSYILKLKDEIKVDIPKEEPIEIKEWHADIEIDILAETDDYIVINKPTGLMVHPGSGNKDKTLINLLNAKKIKLSTISEERPGIVHRLDKDTSGVMVIAKTNPFHSHIVNQFETRQVDKTYLAIVEGNLSNTSGMIDAPIGRDSETRTKMKVTKLNSKEALTVFNVISRGDSNDLVEFKILTGRTHQIRVHAVFIGNPVLNDHQYSKINSSDDRFGQYLHASKLSFIDLDGETKTFEAPLPNEFEKMKQERGV